MSFKYLGHVLRIMQSLCHRKGVKSNWCLCHLFLQRNTCLWCIPNIIVHEISSSSDNLDTLWKYLKNDKKSSTQQKCNDQFIIEIEMNNHENSFDIYTSDAKVLKIRINSKYSQRQIIRIRKM